jgi:hypothetical protein
LPVVRDQSLDEKTRCTSAHPRRRSELSDVDTSMTLDISGATIHQSAAKLTMLNVFALLEHPGNPDTDELHMASTVRFVQACHSKCFGILRVAMRLNSSPLGGAPQSIGTLHTNAHSS